MLAAFVIRTQAFASHPDVLAWAFTFDLTISLPLLWWFFAVRTGRASAVTLIPLFVIARWRGRADHPDGATFVRRSASLHRRAARSRHHRARRPPRGAHSPDRRRRRSDRAHRAGVRGAFGNGYAARAVAFEIAIIYYAFSGWRKRAPAGFTVHQRSGWSTVIGVFIFLIAVESIGAHLVVQMWSVKAAWIVTTLDLYGILWLLGDFQALRLRPTRIENDTLVLNYGLRWRAEIPLSAIAAIEPVHGEAEWKTQGRVEDGDAR